MRRDTPDHRPPQADPSWKIAIIHSSFYGELTQKMVSSAQEALTKAGIRSENISIHDAHGCFEIPLIGAAIAQAQAADALIGLGIIVDGQTDHGRLIADAATKGMMDVQVQYRIPFACEILHVSDVAIAQARTEKGTEAANSVLCSLLTLAGLCN